MTNEQALKIVNRKMTDIEKCAENEESAKWLTRFDNEYSMLCLSKKALERQIPKKPISDLHNVPHYRCPNCNSAAQLHKQDPLYPHCHFCGQAFEWER